MCQNPPDGGEDYVDTADQRSALGHPEAVSLADALWTGVRHTPAIPTASGGLRGWYLDGPYAFVVGRRRRRVWGHRSPEPWLTAQWVLDRGSTPRSVLRYEGLPGQHSYEDAYRAVAAGTFAAPFVFVAGYGRSGTTSVQNLVLASFGSHVPPGSWDAPDHPLRLWWYPKHNAAVAGQIADLDPAVARVIVCIRPFLESSASLALYRGITEPDQISAEWVAEEASQWRRMAEVARQPHVVPFAFDLLPTTSPQDAAQLMAERLGIAPDARIDPTTTWDDLYVGRISPEELDNPFIGNLPHAQRPRLTARLRDRISALVGSAAVELEDAYAGSVAG